MDAPKRKTPWGDAPPPHPRFGRRLLILAGLAALALIALFSYLPPAAWSQDEQIDLARYGLIGLVLLVSAAASRHRLVSIGSGLVIWGVLGLLLVGLYAYRFELGDAWRRVTAELVPTRGQQAPDGTVTFKRSADQHFWIDALVDG